MTTDVIDDLRAAIDRLLGVDSADLADDELHDAVIAVQRQSHRLAALRAQLVSAWDRRGIWAADGSRSAGHRLSRETSTSVSSGKREVRRAAALRSMPHTAVAVADGALSPEHVDLLADANSGQRAVLFESHEETLVEQCKVLRFADAHKMVDYWKQRADAEGTEDDARRQRESRGASAAKTLDGMVDLRALLDPIGAAAVLDELARLMEQLRLEDKADGVVRSTAQRRADALVEMAHRSRTAHEGGLRPRPLLTVRVGDQTLARVCELATGSVVAPGQIVPLLSDADIERVVFDGPDRVISVSRKRRFTGALRRAIEVRDRTCQHPSGCDEPASRCDVDHVRPWSEGGETSLDNGKLGWWPHNRIDQVRNARPTNPTSPEVASEAADVEPDADPKSGVDPPGAVA